MRFRIENHVLVENRPPLPDEMPFEVRLLPQAATQLQIIPWLIINHTQAASRAIPMDQAWNTDRVRTDGIESHLLADQQGRGMQCIPFNVRADTSYKANRFYVDGVGWCGQVSVESQDDGGAGLAFDPWTDPQFEFLCQAWAAVCAEYEIPVQAVTDPYGRGVSQHNAHSAWSKSAHSCPGIARTLQMPAMRARIRQIIEDDAVLVAPPLPPIPPVVVVPPTPEAPSVPQEDTMAMTLFKPTDAAAWFYGQADGKGIAHVVEWTGEGGDPAVAQRLAEETAAGIAVNDTLSIGSFKNCVLVGPMPPDGTDYLHQWRPSDFAKVIQ